MSPAEITQQLGLQSLTRRAWVSILNSMLVSFFAFPDSDTFQFIQSTCATTGDGLYEGLEWLADTLRKTNRD